MIEARGVSKRYGKVQAVDGVSFAVGPGEIFGLLGPNGAGKTTLIRMFTCLTRPNAGACLVDGRDAAREPEAVKPRIGVVPQENNLDRELTARENLVVYGRLHRVPRLAEAAERALDLVGLGQSRDRPAKALSGGMKRRLVIGRALLADPKVLFLDEPSVGLDPQVRRDLWDIVRRVRVEGRSVFLTTHYIEEAEALCDRVGILRKGRLIALDVPENLRQTVGPYVAEQVNGSGKLTQRFARSREEAHALARDLEADAGVVTVRRSNLEDVFVHLTGEKIL